MSTGKYQLVAELARGGMGIVYLAVAKGVAGFQKLLVLKQLKQDLASDREFVEMFLAEARIAASLQHPNVVQTYEVGIDEGRPFLVMDYLDGYSLVQIVKRHDERFTLAHHARALCEVLRGLEYLHNLTDIDGEPMMLVHRDMTPQNIFVTFDGQIKIIDFGIAKSTSSSIETQAGVLKGKPTYMAPEQLHGRADARTDLFAVGVMLWEAVAGRRMWSRRTDTEILGSLLKGIVPSLSEAAPSADPDLAQIIATATHADIEQRYQSARDFRAALEGWLAQHPPAPTAQEVGDAVGIVFAIEREARKQRVDAALKELRSGGGTALPQVQVVPNEGTPSHPSSLLTQTSSISGATHLSQSPPPLENTKKGPPLLQGALLLAVLGVGAFLLLRKEPAAATQPPAPPAVSTQAAAPPQPAPRPAPSEHPTAHPSETAAAATAQPSAAPAASSADPPARPRPGKSYPNTTTTTTTATATAAPPAADCNPPFYFQGTKKIFKPGCF